MSADRTLDLSERTASLTDEDLTRISAELERRSAGAAVRWAVETFGDRIFIAASMQDAVLVDIATQVKPDIEVVFIDTGYHFAETLEMVEQVRDRYSLNLRVMSVPPSQPPLHEIDPERCCSDAKVAQLELALIGRDAWITGLRRAESTSRFDTPIVTRDARGLVKVHPLATWTDEDVAGYVADHDLPVHALTLKGYPSIGCAPCTRPVAPGDDPRSGRWAGLDKTECGLHV